jgi:hypothetical protein
MSDKREKTIQEYRRWLEQYSWSWMATLKLTSGIPSERRATTLFDSWISSVRRAEGAEDFRFFRVLERGLGGSNFHFHTLIGGLRKPRKIWEERWNERGGDAVISAFDPQKNGILYMLKDMDNGGDLDCDFELPTKEKDRDDTEDVPEPAKSIPSTTLRIDRIDTQTTIAELRKLFKPYGRILEIGIIGSRLDDRMLLMSATITMQDSGAAKSAARELNGFELRGLAIEVSVLGA